MSVSNSLNKSKISQERFSIKCECFSQVLKKAFDAFDHDKKGSIGTDMVGTILTMLGYELSEKTLKEIITEVDEDGKKFSTNEKTNRIKTKAERSIL